MKKPVDYAKRSIIYLFLCVFFFFELSADEPRQEGEKLGKQPLPEETVESQSSIAFNGKKLNYTVTTGTILLKEDTGANKATLFYIAYVKSDANDLAQRPITFCFNGGPGSSSVWLHLGLFGPKRVVTAGIGYPVYPYHLENNPESLLAITDLVFIDPVSTGYSRAAPGEDEKQFHGVDEDIQSVAQFIRLYTTRNHRWTSPKYLAGESYGGTRAIGLAATLQDTYNMSINGLILISPAINFQTIDFSRGNDLAYVTALPTYVASAWYHKKLSKGLQDKSVLEMLREGTHFAAYEYLPGLFQGDKISSNDREEIIKQLSELTSFSFEEIKRANLRISAQRFAKGLFGSKDELIGRFDSRYKAFDTDIYCQYCPYDPSLETILGPFTSLFNQYVRVDLKWVKDEEYKVLTNVFPWNFGKASYKCLNMTDSLREMMIKNNFLKVFVAMGIYDLSIPYASTQYALDHLGLPGSLEGNIFTKTYEAGHMMYLDRPSLLQLRKDIEEFMR